MRKDIERLIGDRRAHTFACELCSFESDDLFAALDHANDAHGEEYAFRLVEIAWHQAKNPPRPRCSVAIGHDLAEPAVPCANAATRAVRLYRDLDVFAPVCEKHSAEGWHLNIGD